jgi:type II secretory pathway component PulJ
MEKLTLDIPRHLSISFERDNTNSELTKITVSDKNGNVLKSVECMNEELFSKKATLSIPGHPSLSFERDNTNPGVINITSSDEDGNTLESVGWDIKANTLSTEGFSNLEYSTEASLYISEKRAVSELKDAIFQIYSNNKVRHFLRIIFTKYLRDKKGLFYYDSLNKEISVVEYYRLLLIEINKDKEINKLSNLKDRINNITNCFNNILSLLRKAGWKERTVYEYETVDKFDKIINDYMDNYFKKKEK